MNSAELKQLKTRLAEKKAAFDAANSKKSDVEQEIHRLAKEVVYIQSQIERSTKTDVVISEHACLRYAERILGMDVEAIKRDILPDDVRRQILILGNGVFPCKTHAVKVQNNVVVTIIPPKSSKGQQNLQL